MAGTIKGITVEIGGDVSGLSKALKTLNKPINSTQKELKAIQKGLKFDPKSTTLLAQKQKLLSQSLQDNKTKLKALQEAKAQADAKMAAGGEVNQEQYRQLEREIEATRQKVKQLTTDTSKFTTVGKSISNVGSKFTAVGKALAPLSAAAGAIGLASGKLAMNFEDAMAKVSTIADESEVPIKDLEQSIMDLSDQTGVAATDLANNVYDAISAGQSTGDAVNFVSNATKLAKAGFTDTDSALDVLTTTLNAYGMEASEVNKVSDLLIQTQNDGKVTVGQLAESMGKVIPTAKSANVSFEQLTTSYALLTKNGIASKNATTYLNSMLNELNKSGTAVDKVLRQKTGKSFSQLQSEGKSLGDVLQIISDEAKASGKGFNDMWGNANSAKAAVTLLGDSASTFNDELTKMNGSTGATDTAFGKLGTTSVTFKKALNELKNAGIKLGQALLTTLGPIITTIAEKIKAFTKWFSNLSPAMQQAIAKALLFTAALAPVSMTIGKTLTGIGSLVSMIGKLKGAFALGGSAAASAGGVLASLGPHILAIVAAIGICVAAWKIFKTVMTDTNPAMDEAKKKCQATASAIDELKSSQDSYLDSAQSSMEQTSSQANYYRDLVSELKTLGDAEGNLTDAEKERANVILTELNQALGTEYSMADLVKIKNGELEQSIYNVIAAKEAEAMMSADEEEYTEAIKNRAKATQLVTDAQDDLNEALKAGGKNSDYLQDANSRNSDYYKEFIDNLDKASLAATQNELTIQQHSQALQYQLQGDVAGLSAYLEGVAAANAAIESETNSVAKSMGDNFTVEQQRYYGAVQALKQAVDSYDGSAAAQAKIQSLIQTINAMGVDLEASGSLLGDNFLNGFNGKGEYVDLGGMLTALADQGVDISSMGELLGTDYIDSIINGVQAGVPDVSSATTGAVTSAISDGESAALGGFGLGGFLTGQIQQGIDANKPTVNVDVNGSLANIQSQGIALGNSIMQQFGLGIEQGQGLGVSATTGAVDAANTAGTNESNGFTSVGYNIGTGIASGVNQSSPIVEQAVRTVVQNAKKAANNEAVIKSPSHVFRDEVGYYIGAGIGVGIEKATKFVEDKTAALIGNALGKASEYSKAVGDITKGLLEDEKYYLNDAAKAEGEAESKRFAQRILNATTTEEKLQIVRERASYRAKLSQKSQADEMKNAIADMNKVLDADEKTKESFIDRWQDKYQDAIDTIKDKLSDFAKSLRGQFDLTTTSTIHIGALDKGFDTDITTLTNFKEASSYIQLFKDNLESIRDKVPTDLFDEIREIGEKDIGKANKLINAFNGMTEADQQEWVNDYLNYQQLVGDVTESLYSPDVKEYVEELGTDFDEEFKALETDFTSYGFTAADKFIQGFKEKMSEIKSGFGSIFGDATSTDTSSTSTSVAPVNITINMTGTPASAYEVAQKVKESISNVYRQAVTAY